MSTVPGMIALDDGSKVRADTIFAVRPLDAIADGRCPPRVVVEYACGCHSYNSINIDCPSMGEAINMATSINLMVKKALAELPCAINRDLLEVCRMAKRSCESEGGDYKSDPLWQALDSAVGKAEKGD